MPTGLLAGWKLCLHVNYTALLLLCLCLTCSHSVVLVRARADVFVCACVCMCMCACVSMCAVVDLRMFMLTKYDVLVLYLFTLSNE